MIDQYVLPQTGWVFKDQNGKYGGMEEKGISMLCLFSQTPTKEETQQQNKATPEEVTFEQARQIAKQMGDDVAGIVIIENMKPVYLHFVK